jgi:hypothetical protein
MVKKDTGTRSPTAQEIKDWTSWGEKAPKWNLEESRDLIKRHIFGGDFPKVTADGNGSYDGADHPQLKHYVIENAAGKSSLALGGGKDEYVIWIILKNLLAELQNLVRCSIVP